MNAGDAGLAFVFSWVGGDEQMSAEQSKNLMEQRADLEKQLRGLKQRRNLLYTPGITIVSGHAASSDEQIDLQIEELQATIAQIDEALKNAKNA